MKNVFMLLAFFAFLPLAASAQSSLVGSWKMSVPDQAGNMVPVSITMKDDGSYEVDFAEDGTINVTGNYETDGSQITIQDTGGPNACEDKKGVYKFTVSADQLIMERISDECEGRGGPEGKMVLSKG